jgi:hypothetical protein
MKIAEILNEGTYNLNGIVNKIFDNVIYYFHSLAQDNKKLTTKAADITKYFSELKIPISLTMKIVRKADTSGKIKQTKNKEGKLDKYSIEINFDTDFVDEDFEDVKKEYSESLIHELSHMMDSFRSNGIAIARPKKEHWNSIYRYLKDPTEFNALIHEIKLFRSKNLRTWNRKITYDSLKNYMKESVYLLQKSSKWQNYDINQEKNLFRKIFERLARENLLPADIK